MIRFRAYLHAKHALLGVIFEGGGAYMRAEIWCGKHKTGTGYRLFPLLGRVGIGVKHHIRLDRRVVWMTDDHRMATKLGP